MCTREMQEVRGERSFAKILEFIKINLTCFSLLCLWKTKSGFIKKKSHNIFIPPAGTVLLHFIQPPALLEKGIGRGVIILLNLN